MKWLNPTFQCYFMWVKDNDMPSLLKGFSPAKHSVSSELIPLGVLMSLPYWLSNSFLSVSSQD